MEPILKPYEQQYIRQKIEAARARHLAKWEAERADYEQQIVLYQGQLETAQTEQEREAAQRVIAHLEREREEARQKAERTLRLDDLRLGSPYYRAEDYELSALTDPEQAEFHLRQTHPEGNPYLQTAFIPQDSADSRFTPRGMKLENYVGALPHLLSLLGHTYVANAEFTSLRVYEERRKYARTPDGELRESSRTFTYQGRKKPCVLRVQSYIIDLDYREIPALAGKSAKEVITLMRAAGKFDLIEPSYFISTSEGRGLYIVYLLSEPYLIWDEPDEGFQPCHAKRIDRWERLLREKLVPQFLEYGADRHATDITRVFRVPGSYHPKVDGFCRIVDFEAVRSSLLRRYSFDELEALTARLPEPPAADRADKPAPKADAEPKPPKRAEKPQPVQHTPVEPSPLVLPDGRRDVPLAQICHRRCLDLETLIRLRDGNLTGHRETLLHIYATQYALFAPSGDAVQERIAEINGMFTQPLAQREIDVAARYRAYRYSDGAILSQLAIQRGELERLQCIGHGRNAQRRNERKRRVRRDSSGVLHTQQRREARNQKILSLHREGRSVRQIASLTECSVGTVHSVIKSQERA